MTKYKCNRNKQTFSVKFSAIIQLVLCVYVASGQEIASNDVEFIDQAVRPAIDEGAPAKLTELPGGRVVGERVLRLSDSPYFLQEDLNVERGGTLIIEPGVTIHVAPMVGITVRGALNALVSSSIRHNNGLR